MKRKYTTTPLKRTPMLSVTRKGTPTGLKNAEAFEYRPYANEVAMDDLITPLQVDNGLLGNLLWQTREHT